MQTDYNSTNNQAIKSKLVQREIGLNFNQIMGVLETTGELNVMDTECQYMRALYNDEEITEQQQQELLEELEDERSKDISNEREEQIQIEIEDLEDLEFDIYPDVMEYWQVSDYMADKLADQGEVLFWDVCGFKVWGRTCSGQAILLDHVISMIADDMNILEGQSNSWHPRVDLILFSDKYAACQLLQGEGLETMMNTYDSDSYELIEIPEGSRPFTYLKNAQAWNDYSILTKDEYETLKNRP